MTQKTHFSRRAALKAAGGTAMAAALPAASASSNTDSPEIESFRSQIGTRYKVGDSDAVYALEKVDPLTPHVRPPFTVGHRQPFALVFKRVRGDKVSDGTHVFAAALRAGQPLMVSTHDGEDGESRLEAVFN